MNTYSKWLRHALGLLVLLLALPLFAQRPAPPAARPLDKLSLTAEQQTQIREIREKYRAEIETLRAEPAEDRAAQRESLRAVMQAQREEIDAVLNDEQRAQLKSMEEARREERRRAEIDREGLRQELKTYREANILPVLREQRARLDAKISDADKATIAGIRQQLAGLRRQRPEAAASPEERRARHEAMREATRQPREQLRALVEKYDADIESLLTAIEPQRKQWQEDQRAIFEKYRPADDARPGPAPDRVKRAGKQGPPRPGHRQGTKEMSKTEFLLLDPAATPAPGRPRPAEAQAFPNPARNTGTIAYTVQLAGEVRIELRDKEGRLVRVLLDQHQPAGKHSVEVDLSQLNDGIYYYTIIDQSGQATKQLVVAKE